MNEQDKPDPFAAYASDRTIIKPSAGRVPKAGVASNLPSADASGKAFSGSPSTAGLTLPDLPPFASMNALVQTAAPLLNMAPRLRMLAQHPDLNALRSSLADAVHGFDASARAQNLPNDQIIGARYVLCTFLDESVSGTPWGGNGAWNSRSLLVQFHNENNGGEKVFQLLARLAQSPAQHSALLELIWVVMSLGFVGRYRVLDNGLQQLEQVRQNLGRMIRDLAGPPEKSLSPQWLGVAEAPLRLRDGIPMWVVAAASALLLLLFFVGLRLSLNAQTDTTFSALQTIDVKAPTALTTTEPSPLPASPPPPRLAQLLQADITAGLIQVRDGVTASVVTITGDTLFDPGQAGISARALPLFQRIGTALNQLPGQVVITGHTDNQPIRSLRFPSNWHLSKDRAQAVQSLLAASVKSGRLTAEGRADSEPVADNSSAEGRARNRRVEVTLLVAESSN